MNILPELYPVWLKAWLDTLAEVDPKWNGELEAEWKRQLQPCIDAMTAAHPAAQ